MDTSSKVDVGFPSARRDSAPFARHTDLAGTQGYIRKIESEDAPQAFAEALPSCGGLVVRRGFSS
jgi:hypothetical protein